MRLQRDEDVQSAYPQVPYKEAKGHHRYAGTVSHCKDSWWLHRTGQARLNFTVLIFKWGEDKTFKNHPSSCLEYCSVTQIPPAPPPPPHPIPSSSLPTQGVTQQEDLPTAQNVRSGTHAWLSPWIRWLVLALCAMMTSWQKDLHYCPTHKRLHKPQTNPRLASVTAALRRPSRKTFPRTISKQTSEKTSSTLETEVKSNRNLRFQATFINHIQL